MKSKILALLLMCQLPFIAVAKEETLVKLLTTPLNSINTIIVPVEINKKKYTFLLDSGASFTAIDTKLIKQLTIPLSNTDIRIIQGKNEYSEGLRTASSILQNQKYYKPKTFYIGSQAILNNDWISMDMSLVSQGIGVKIDGILGVDTFRQFIWEIDNKNKLLHIYQHTTPATKYQRCVPYRDSSSLSPELGFDFKGQWIPFLLDTGAKDSIISKSLVDYLNRNKALTLVSHKTVSASISEITNDNMYLINNFTFDEQPMGKMLVNSTDQEIVNLGMNFLKRMDSYIFNPYELLFCYNGFDASKDDVAPLRNIAIRFFNNALEFFYNDATTISNFKLKNQDQLISINNQQAKPENIETIRLLLANTAAGKLRLKIKRDGKILDIKI